MSNLRMFQDSKNDGLKTETLKKVSDLLEFVAEFQEFRPEKVISKLKEFEPWKVSLYFMDNSPEELLRRTKVHNKVDGYQTSLVASFENLKEAKSIVDIDKAIGKCKETVAETRSYLKEILGFEQFKLPDDTNDVEHTRRYNPGKS